MIALLGLKNKVKLKNRRFLNLKIKRVKKIIIL